jgi:hypothetical protein
MKRVLINTSMIIMLFSCENDKNQCEKNYMIVGSHDECTTIIDFNPDTVIMNSIFVINLDSIFSSTEIEIECNMSVGAGGNHYTYYSQISSNNDSIEYLLDADPLYMKILSKDETISDDDSWGEKDKAYISYSFDPGGSSINEFLIDKYIAVRIVDKEKEILLWILFDTNIASVLTVKEIGIQNM